MSAPDALGLEQLAADLVFDMLELRREFHRSAPDNRTTARLDAAREPAHAT
jgi:hypothetical protein